MIVETNNGSEIEISKVDNDGEICFEITAVKFERSQIVWIEINKIQSIIEFLTEQVQFFEQSVQAE